LDRDRVQTSQGTLTILFTDLEGSTDMRVRFGDATANEVINAHDAIVRAQLEMAGGVESKSLGDGFMALFTSANRAIEAAVSIQRAIEEHNQSNPGVPIAVRMGLNSGDVTQSGGDAHGTAVHAAARIAAKAQGGQILASQIVHELAGTLAETRIVDRGLFWLKGFPDRWRLFEVLWRDKDGKTERATKEIRAASAAAFDLGMPRAEGRVVGRAREQEVIREQVEAAPSAGLRAVILEGEAGIGKTRMLEDTSEMASGLTDPFWVLDVTADEELRGPFLLFRSLLTSPRTLAVAQQAMALEQLDRAQEAIAGRSSGLEGLSPQEQMLRTFDEVASAISALTRERPVALLLDDVQWADEDSIQLIRYLVRTLASGPLFLLISIRPYYDLATSGVGKLIADLDRMRVTKVLRLQRLTRIQTGELLENILGSPVDESTLQSIHARSEGVPFFVEELVRAYREAEALQLMDGTWTMTRLSGPAVPSSVQSLIERRLAQLPEDHRALLADAGVLGRRFSLTDLSAAITQLQGEQAKSEWQLSEDLELAVGLGLIAEEPEGTRYDYSFSHDQIRASLLDSISRQRQRAIHGAVAEILRSKGGKESLSMLAFHSLKAGDQAQAVASAIEAARVAMEFSAPEESVRLIDATLPAASNPEDRIEMLRVKDDALAVLDRGSDRMANLAEMTALTAAFPSSALDTEVKLRRASAARANQDYDLAVDIAETLCNAAKPSGDLRLELAACFELGQAITRSPLGESYWPLGEVDLEAAEATFRRALEISREVGARLEEADALRELAVIEHGRTAAALQNEVDEGASRLELLLAGGTELLAKAKDLAEQAFHIYEELGDRRGSMSALISMAYTHLNDPSTSGMAGRLEHIRALHHSRKGEVTESQRATDDALMLYSIHVYARQNAQPDLALARGQQAFDAARALGDGWLECLAAGGLAMTYLTFGATEEATPWLDRAAKAAMSVANTSMARRMEMWRGAHAASRGDAAQMISHYERAGELAGQKNLGGRCEAQAALAFECARLGVAAGDDALMGRARTTALETLDAVRPISGRLPWTALAHAALALVAQAEGDDVTAAEEARASLDLDTETHVSAYIQVLWVAGRILIRQGEPEAEGLTQEILGGLSYVSMLINDPDIKSRWFAVPEHSELAGIVGFERSELEAEEPAVELSDSDLEVLRDLASGTVTARRSTDDGATDANEEVDRLFAKLGVGSETEAIEFAIKSGVTWR